MKIFYGKIYKNKKICCDFIENAVPNKSTLTTYKVLKKTKTNNRSLRKR